MRGHPTFNQEKLTKRAKRSVGFVLQVSLHLLLLPSCMSCNAVPPRLSYHIFASVLLLAGRGEEPGLLCAR